MAGTAIDGAEEEHHVIRIDGVMTEVKEHDGHLLAMPGKQGG
jgi:hypothetical protein